MVFDPLLVHYLARELDRRMRGRACAAAPHFTAGRTVTLPMDRGEALQLDLHPRRGWIRLVRWEEESDELESLCVGVGAPADERRLEIRLHAADRFRVEPRALVVELHANQWNALLLSEAGSRILATAWSRAAGARQLRTGAAYQPPHGSPRLGAGEVSREEAREEWDRVVAAAPEEERARALVRRFAYTGVVNAGPILADASPFERWWSLRALPEPRPVLLRHAGRLLPYPLPLPGVDSEPVESLLAGMTRVAEGGARAPTADEGLAPLLARVRRRAAAAERRVERLEAQRSEEGAVDRLRLQGDLLLANFHAVPRGESEARLTDWEGNPVVVPLDPALSVAENAARWYDRARRRSRAEAQLPRLLEVARAEAEAWRRAAEEAEATARLPDWAVAALERSTDGRETRRGARTEAAPYRLFRTSGGLEVRVGRSAKENDRLTFAHSSPNDVWLHARSVAGSHVILRWSDDAAPPARDLEEAAGLAALFSKARTSALVPVDFTRRKYVRKPRGAPPGSVSVLRAKTLFVEPDDASEERLRTDYSGS